MSGLEEWIFEKHSAQTKDFLNGNVTVVLDLLQPAFDAGERFNSTHVVDDDYTVCAAVESAPTYT